MILMQSKTQKSKVTNLFILKGLYILYCRRMEAGYVRQWRVTMVYNFLT